MKFKFNFHHVDYSQALAFYSQEEIEKVCRFFLTGGTCQLFYRMGRYDCQVQVDVYSSWGHFKASGKGDSFYIAVDEVVNKLNKQLKKTKEKHQSHHKIERSKMGRLRRVNAQLEFDTSPYLTISKRAG